MAVIHEQLAANRARIVSALEGSPVAEVAYPNSQVSVALIQLSGGWTSTRLWGRLVRRGVSAVPGRPIWWAKPRDGERYLRVALARAPETVERAAREIRAELDSAA